MRGECRKNMLTGAYYPPHDHRFAKYQGVRVRSERSYMAIATRDRAMEIERTAFGTITIDGKTYDHDVVIRLSGEIVKRKKKLSKKYYGTRV